MELGGTGVEYQRIRESYLQIVQDIHRCFTDAKRSDSVALIAVSKQIDASSIRVLLDLGHRDFGENYVQEAQEKWIPLKEEYPDVRLHYIGSLQRKKLKAMLPLFDVIHTIDRIEHGLELQKLYQSQCYRPELLIQVNVDPEVKRSGVAPTALRGLYSDLKITCGLEISGLMCIPPKGKPVSPYFAYVNRLAQGLSLKELSMGMSADYSMAIMLGATYVRIGQALFGERLPPR